MLLILVKKVVKNFLIKQSDAFKIVTTFRFETNNFINQPVRFM